MIAPPSGTRVWLANGHTDMRRGMNGLALQVQQALGRERAATIYTLIATAKLNGVDPRAWLADTLRRIAKHPTPRLYELLPWNWKPSTQAAAAA